jgi:hypothetical protein
MFACIGNQGRFGGQSDHPNDHSSAGLVLAGP